MPHQYEMVDTPINAVERILSLSTSSSERHQMLRAYTQDLSILYARLELIHTSFLILMYEYPDVEYEQMREWLVQTDITQEEIEICMLVFEQFHLRRESNVAIQRALVQLVQEILKSEQSGLTLSEEENVYFQTVILATLLTQQSPKGHIERVEFPFAQGIRFHTLGDIEGADSDFSAEYRDKQSITELPSPFSLIVLGPYSDEKSSVHEETHCQNAALSSALDKAGIREAVWGTNTEMRDTIKNYLPTNEEASDRLKYEVAKEFFPHLFTHVKDEVIAYFNAEDNFTVAITKLWQSRVKKYTFALEQSSLTYDYFGSANITPQLFSDRKARYYNQLVDEFNATLKKNTQFLRLLWGLSLYEGKQRIHKTQLLSFMRFTPFEQWQRIGRHVFNSELKSLRKIQTKMEHCMLDWQSRIVNIEAVTDHMLQLPNMMSYHSFRNQSQRGNGDDIAQISPEGDAVCQQIDILVLSIDDKIATMKDLSIRHDLYNETSLQEFDQLIKTDLQLLSLLMKELLPHYKRAYWV